VTGATDVRFTKHGRKGVVSGIAGTRLEVGAVWHEGTFGAHRNTQLAAYGPRRRAERLGAFQSVVDEHTDHPIGSEGFDGTSQQDG
jgi:hypothetical protein